MLKCISYMTFVKIKNTSNLEFNFYTISSSVSTRICSDTNVTGLSSNRISMFSPIPIYRRATAVCGTTTSTSLHTYRHRTSTIDQCSRRCNRQAIISIGTYIKGCGVCIIILFCKYKI